MRGIKYTAVSVALLLLVACSDEPEDTTASAPVIEEADRLAPVALKIPGVDGDAPVAPPSLPVPEELPDTNDTIERSIPPVAEEEGEVVPTIDAPLPLLLSDVVGRRFANLASENNGLPMLNAVFYPLGWSVDGKFAYAVEPPAEASDSYFLNIYIQDLVTDKILWKQEYRSDPASADAIGSFAAYWAAADKVITSQFEKYAISEVEQANLMAGPIGFENDQLTYEVNKTRKPQADFGNANMVTNYDVRVRSAVRGSKQVHKETFAKPINVLDLDVIGYMQGSDPERIALLVSGVRRGWEGPPNVTWFKVIGTNLRRGFK
ncbi:hypothetical protein EOL70_15130 [Leucothrix sargassi]|nr:hypothetical protein EOL70_15130 [Leucothrix sargassi]